MNITNLFLHTELFIPGIGTITSKGGGATLTSGSSMGAKFKGLTMEGSVEGVKLSVNNVAALIPWANIKLAIYDKTNR